jgi:hypothetical protein
MIALGLQPCATAGVERMRRPLTSWLVCGAPFLAGVTNEEPRFVPGRNQLATDGAATRREKRTCVAPPPVLKPGFGFAFAVTRLLHNKTGSRGRCARRWFNYAQSFTARPNDIAVSMVGSRPRRQATAIQQRGRHRPAPRYGLRAVRPNPPNKSSTRSNHAFSGSSSAKRANWLQQRGHISVPATMKSA